MMVTTSLFRVSIVFSSLVSPISTLPFPVFLSFEYVLELEKGGQFLLIFDNKTEKLPKLILI